MGLYRNRLRELSSGGRLRTGGRLRVCELLVIYFAVRPDDSVTRERLQEIWGIEDRSSLWKSAMALESRGLLTVTRAPSGHTYSAGPELKSLLTLLPLINSERN